MNRGPKEPEGNPGEKRKRLLRSGLWAASIGLLLIYGALITAIAVSRSIPYERRDTLGFVAVGVSLLGFVLLGMGMADLGERQNRPRSLGILAILGIVGFLVVMLMPLPDPQDRDTGV